MFFSSFLCEGSTLSFAYRIQSLCRSVAGEESEKGNHYENCVRIAKDLVGPILKMDDEYKIWESEDVESRCWDFMLSFFFSFFATHFLYFIWIRLQRIFSRSFGFNKTSLLFRSQSIAHTSSWYIIILTKTGTKAYLQNNDNNNKPKDLSNYKMRRLCCFTRMSLLFNSFFPFFFISMTARRRKWRWNKRQ